MDGSMDRWIDGSMEGMMDGWMDGLMEGMMDGWMGRWITDGWTDG